MHQSYLSVSFGRDEGEYIFRSAYPSSPLRLQISRVAKPHYFRRLRLRPFKNQTAPAPAPVNIKKTINHNFITTNFLTFVRVFSFFLVFSTSSRSSHNGLADSSIVAGNCTEELLQSQRVKSQPPPSVRACHKVIFFECKGISLDLKEKKGRVN